MNIVSFFLRWKGCEKQTCCHGKISITDHSRFLHFGSLLLTFVATKRRLSKIEIDIDITVLFVKEHNGSFCFKYSGLVSIVSLII